MLADLPRLFPAESLPEFTIKSTPEDFVVEEIPAYEPGGEGEHLYLWIEKRNCSHEWLQKQLARALDVPKRDLGTAGIKDRWAVTRQWVSVPASCEPRVADCSSPDFQILKVARHRNKLKTGHLRGNRFQLLLRSSDPANVPLEQLVERARLIAAHGFPNYYGDQRFGRDADNAELGKALVRGEAGARDIPFERRRFLLKMALSALQSELFNETLARRIRANQATTVIAGDVLQVVESGGCFLCEDPHADQPRLDAGEVVPTGPLFGPKMKSASGETAACEQAVLESAGLNMTHFERHSALTQGARRAMLVRPGELTVTPAPEGVLCSFVLPSGVYATTLLRELAEIREFDHASGPADTADEE